MFDRKKYNRENLKRWRCRYREMLIQLFGGECQECMMKETLEFAHKKPTGLNGQGRGSIRRIYDVMMHPEAYMLLCKEHHKLYDASHTQEINPEDIKREVAYVYHRSLSKEDPHD